MESGVIEMELHYLRNSSSSSFLLILSQGLFTGYYAVNKQNGQDHTSVLIEGLPQGEYAVSGYGLQCAGIGNHSLYQKPAVSLSDIVIYQGVAPRQQSKASKNV